jgi:diketogulonate reductase-like aldo/keto reductase
MVAQPQVTPLQDCTRRDFVSRASLAMAACFVVPRRTEHRRAPMITRPIPSSGERVPVIGLGTWQTFDHSLSDAATAARLTETLRVFRDAGGTVIDSSPMYGESERTVGTLAQRLGIIDQLFVATKVWTTGERAGVEQMRESMSLLHRQKMDLMQIHNLVDWRTHLATLRRWKAEGRVRYIGITHYLDSSYSDLEAIVRREPIDFVQLAYSPAYRGAERSLLPACADRGVAVLVNRPFEGGDALRRMLGKPVPRAVAAYAATWPQAFLKFILGNPAVTCVIPGTGNPRHMADNVAAGLGRLPTERERAALVASIA